MPDLTDIKNNWQQYDIRLLAVGISLLISIVAMLAALLFPVLPNNDSYTYIRTAEIFREEGLAAAFQHYSWASYSVLIALLGNLGFSLVTSAHIINGGFYALLVYSFISIVKEIDESKHLLLLAAVSILVYPQLNEYRSYIVRDAGFWALTIFSFYQFLLYSREQSLIRAIAFCSTLLLAATFRAESIIFLGIVPFALLFDARYDKLHQRKNFLRLYAIISGLGVAALLLVTLAGFNVLTLFTNFISVYLPIISTTLSPSPELAAELSALLFSEHAAFFSQEYLPIFVAAGLLAILIANMYNGIGGPFLIILLIGVFSKRVQLKIGEHVSKPLSAYLLVNFAVLFLFIFLTRYMSSRYTMIFSILLVLYVPFIAYQLLTAASTRRKQLIIFMSLFFTYCAIDSYVSFGDRKDYLFDSIDWIADNADKSVALNTNNPGIAYSSGMVENYDLLIRRFDLAQIEAANSGDLFVIEFDFTLRQFFNSAEVAPHLKLLQNFPDDGDPQLSIYERIVLTP